MKLFEIDPKTRQVDLNKEWISTIKEFKKILSRDRGSAGDADGRRKLQANKEFTFIYHYCDYGSKFDNYSEEDKLKQSVVNAELPDSFNFKKDEDLVNAIARYKEMQTTPALKIIAEAKEGLHHSHRVIRKIRMHLEIELEKIDLTKISEEPDDPDIDPKRKKADPISKITTSLENLMKLTNTIGPALKNLRELEEEVKKELGDKQGLRGGREKGIREEATGMTRQLVEKESEEGSTGEAGMFNDV